MEFGMPLTFKTEFAFWEECYKIGMKNGWCSGEFARADGDFIDENDCLNKDSVFVIDTKRELIRYFKHGNWCLGSAVIFENLCFIQQDNGGDEYLTMKLFSDGVVRTFESISFGHMIEKKEDNMYEYIKGLTEAVCFLKDGKFTKTDSRGNIVRKGKNGLAVMETKMYLSVSYGTALKEDLEDIHGVIAI